jgi:ribosome-associated protein
MLRVTGSIAIDESELDVEFIRSSGPGGQHVNRTASAVKLRFDAKRSPSLPDEVKERLAREAGSRMTGEGVVIIHARRYRSQHRNRQDAMDRLVALVRKAAAKPATRRRTRPGAAAKRRRVEEKRRRGQVKKLRAKVKRPEE